MPKRQCGKRFGNPLYAAISFIWSYVRISKTVGKKSSPASAASFAILFCSSRRYAGSAVFSATSLMLGAYPAASIPATEELFDGSHDCVLVADLARDHPVVLAEVLAQVFDELTRAVRALDLPVGEHVYPRQELVLQDFDAEQRIGHGPVVPVRKGEWIDVP